jgi:glycosyltransferase involved in cell wall biosynthesis
MIGNKQLSIILPSYNDLRIERAIKSIRRFDDIQAVKILVIDGGSSDRIIQLISNNLTGEDTFISEPDKGIFDALNKGLNVCDTEFIGWLGSDDMFTGKILASQVVAALSKCDLFVANLWFFRNGYVTRMTPALPSKLGLMKFGLHNPHFATFGSAALLKSERFTLGLRASDIEYFIKIFNKKPRVEISNIVATLQEEGGFSTKSNTGILHSNLESISFFSRDTNRVMGTIAVLIKLGSKLVSRAYYKIFRVRV